MRKLCGIGSLLALAVSFTACQSKQTSAPQDAPPAAATAPPIVWTGAIPLEGVKGRFDHHRLFVGTREPATLSVFDTNTGHMVASLPSVQDTDDLYYSADHKRIYVPGGEGFIYVFQQNDPDHYSLVSKVPTSVGARTAGYFGRQGKGFDRFYLAIPASISAGAEVRVYTVQD